MRQELKTLVSVGLQIFGMIGLAIWLFGCGGPMIFARAGGTEAQLSSDGYDCDQQWERSAGGIAFRHDPMGNAYYGIKARSDKEECMKQKGWVRTQ